MTTDTTTPATTNKIEKYVVLRIPKNLHFRLSLRGRVVLARLARIGPLSAKKLAEEHLGGMVRRERGLAQALTELKKLGLAKHDSDGWIAVEPSGEVRAGFRWQKEGKGAWRNRYIYTKVPLPRQPPWRKSNALELWCVYWVMKDNIKAGKPTTLGKLSRALGITKKTARSAIASLCTMGHIVRAGNKLQLQKITDHFLMYQGLDYSEPEDESPTAASLRSLGIHDPQAIIETATAVGLFGEALLTFARRLHNRHDAGKWGDDPSKFILAAMKNRHTHRARGGVK